MKKFDLSLYLVTDPDAGKERTVQEVVEKAISGGVTMVQMREKEGDTGQLLEKAKKLKEILEENGIPFIIDDRIDIMLAVDADGVHVGQSDMPCAVARKLIGEDKILGVSVHTVEEAMKAEKEGADYLGVGAIFSTKTKKDADAVSLETLKKIVESASIPIVAIGGIHAKNAMRLQGSGIHGIAVVSAIMKAEDPMENAKALKEIVKEIKK